MDEPLLAYDFFAPGLLPGYVGNQYNINGCIEADVPLLGELGEMGEPLGADVDELMVDLVIDELVEPIVKVEATWSCYASIGDRGFMYPHGNLEYSHGLLVKKVITVSDAKVADNIAIRELSPRVSTVEDQMQVMASQMVQVVRRLE
nr:hypothetical protein [Tanacetum cinerariifolium]